MKSDAEIIAELVREIKDLQDRVDELETENADLFEEIVAYSEKGVSH